MTMETHIFALQEEIQSKCQINSINFELKDWESHIMHELIANGFDQNVLVNAKKEAEAMLKQKTLLNARD